MLCKTPQEDECETRLAENWMEIGPAAQAKEAGPEILSAIRADLAETLRPHATEQGIELGYAAWLVNASASR